ncbi:MAG: hypothetical protein IJL09_07150, partial [Lachnospiraceae bacterium]|nr:hypothetical protein [Lachnospiraceae bacterium]
MEKTVVRQKKEEEREQKRLLKLEKEKERMYSIVSGRADRGSPAYKCEKRQPALETCRLSAYS